MLVAEEAVEVRVLRRQGKSIREIALVLDVSRSTDAPRDRARLPSYSEGVQDWSAGLCQTGAMSERIARIRIALQDIEPEIWRRVEVPLDLRAKGSAGSHARFAMAGGLVALTVLMGVGIFGVTMFMWRPLVAVPK